MSTLILPPPIAAYFSADKLNPEAVVRCFTKDAVVKDEGRAHVGLDAIRAWKMEASRKYSYTSEAFAIADKDGRHLVSSRVSGNFPGSPIDLSYDFRLERGLIASLEISV